MTSKLALSIKKYTKEMLEEEFLNDISEIEKQNILYRKDNFLIDLSLENSINIKFAIDNFNKVYGKKLSNLSNQNFTLTFSILNENFFENIDLESFQEQFYKIIFDKIDVLSFIVTKDNIGDITFYFICTSIVKEIFLDHIIKDLLDNQKEPEALTGVLSYNLILGGKLNEKPEQKFVNMIINELNNTIGCNLVIASDSQKQKYILESYNRASSKIANIYKDYDALLEHLEKGNPKFIPYINNLIKKHNLTTLDRSYQ